MYRMCSGGGDECILVTCGAVVSTFDVNFVEAYIGSLLSLHIITNVGTLHSRQWHVGEVISRGG